MQPGPSGLPPLVGEAPAFLDLMEKVSRLAGVDRPVLVIGERGTGKELVASRLHYLSPRWNAPFVRINAAAMPEQLLASEIFGHESGAFTGAVRRRAGRFEQADGGTLFLDEIGLADMAVQEQLLRVVEYGSFHRLGGDAEIEVDVRLIAASNEDLPAAAMAGKFRHDLLDRLSFDVVNVPPLRHRAEDIMPLAVHFGRSMALELGWPDFRGFAPEAERALRAWHWPGNVRELRNVAERAVARWPHPELPVGEIEINPFASPWRVGGKTAADKPKTEPRSFKQAVAALERDMLEEALAATGHNRRAAARYLDLSYDQLRHALKRHGLGEPASG